MKPFADAVAGLKKGEYTQTPVQTQYGWHVIQLLDSRETPVPPIDRSRIASLSSGTRSLAPMRTS